MVILSVLTALALDGGIYLFRAAGEKRAGFGAARWIWISRAPKRAPVRFSTGSAFTLPTRPPRAVARVFAPPRFTLWVNGARAGDGSGSAGNTGAAFDVAPFLREGSNSIAILAESRDGVGGILFALSDEAGRAILVSNAGWTMDRRAGVPPVGQERAALLGPPPRYPWGGPWHPGRPSDR